MTQNNNMKHGQNVVIATIGRVRHQMKSLTKSNIFLNEVFLYDSWLKIYNRKMEFTRLSIRTAVN